MPRGDPFTALCQLAAGLSRTIIADLHLHTTASDGDYTPSQVMAFARQAKLEAIAITDHDTFAGIDEAVEMAGTDGPRVIPGIELTAEWNGHEVHLLGYLRGGCSLFSASRLNEIVHRRRERFRDFIQKIRDAGYPLDEGLVAAVESTSASLGRRHVANLLVRTGISGTYREAWQRFVGPFSAQVLPKLRLPFSEAVRLIHDANGVSSLAHPSSELCESDLHTMKAAGLVAVEGKFPAAGVERTVTLIGWAKSVGLAVTGGSDYHGGENPTRKVGSYGLMRGEWQRLCQLFSLG
jgi:hypothetical protein